MNPIDWAQEFVNTIWGLIQSLTGGLYDVFVTPIRGLYDSVLGLIDWAALAEFSQSVRESAYMIGSASESLDNAIPGLRIGFAFSAFVVVTVLFVAGALILAVFRLIMKFIPFLG